MKHGLAALAAILSLLSAVSFAHEGHDHGAEAPPLPPPTSDLEPRLEAVSPDFELVAVLEAGQLVIWLDRQASNEPVTAARIEVDSPAFKGLATVRVDGSYALAAAALVPPGTYPLVFSIEAPAGSDLLNGVLQVPAPAAMSREAPPTPPSLAVWAAGGLLVVALGLWFWRQRRPA
jgi:hypothetical protein